jgi:hypothetical protein
MIPSSLFKNKNQLIFAIVSLVAFVLVLLRAKMTPFTHDETATFYFIVQNGHYMPYHAHLDTNNHILNSALTHLFYSLFGSSKFVLRLPNVLFYVFFLFGVYRISKHLSYKSSMLFLIATLIFSYNWFTFFSVSRGYGLSFTAFIMAMSHAIDYFKNNQFKHVIWLGFWMQLAMAASLIMMPVFCIIIGLISLHQLLNKSFFKLSNLISLLINGALIYYWAAFSSYLKEQNGLTHGAGDSYWHVTFETLIYMVSGSYSQYLQAILVVVSVLFLFSGILFLSRELMPLKDLIRKPYAFFLLLFLAEMIAMYAMKQVMGVNYPEDRTALFFYATLVLYIVFFTDTLPFKPLQGLTVLISLTLIIQFALKLNFRKQELYIYDTFPVRFYDKLLAEQKDANKPITIGGHRCREFIYGFMNYRNDGALNAMFAPELLHMNADYLIAKAGEKPYYDWLYEEIDSEPDWDFRLLKRKEKIEYKPILEVNDKTFTGNGEFYELLNETDNKLFGNTNPVKVDFSFKADSVPVPFEAWLVVQIDSINGNKHCFSRSSLNWIKLNYNEDKTHTYSVITPPLPSVYRNFKAFIWNIKQQPMRIHFQSMKVYQMHGKGINYVAPIYF